MRPSGYHDESTISERVARGEHRAVVGGLWEELGTLQLEFLRSRGLAPTHTLLDIGCGSLRGGVHFVRYLDPGNYFGIDISQSLLDAGFERELVEAGVQDRLPRQQLLCDSEFAFETFGRTFDFAIAQSVFTHLTFNHVRDCLEKLAPVMKPGGVFYATFFELPADQPSGRPVHHGAGGIVTYATQDPYHYRADDFEHACRGLPWSARYLGDWAHPRGQRMMAFTRSDAPSARDRTSPRALSFENAAALQPGDEHYRAYVGPPDRFDFMSGTQFSLLFANGLRDHHRVLDFGCGSLRLGRLLIPMLRRGGYFGIDPNSWLIEDALKHELGEQIVSVKSPSFASNSDFDCSVFGTTFHFIMAQSIVTHCGPDRTQTLLARFAEVLEADGLLLFSYLRTVDRDAAPPGDGWHYPACVEYREEHIDMLLAQAGLVGTAIPWYHPGASWHAASRSRSRLPTEQEKRHLSGAVLFDPQFSDSVTRPGSTD